MREIDSLFEKGIEDRVFPSASLLVFKGDTILYERYYGSYEYGSGKMVSKSSLYDLASLTKPLVTSMGIALLVQNREIRLDREMGYYFREFKRVDKLNITVQDMLNHRAGLPSHKDYFKEFPEELWGTAVVRDSILKMVLNEDILEYGKTLYSDIDFMILGYLIEVISGEDLRAFIKREFFRHLSVNESDFCGNKALMKPDVMVPVSGGVIGVDDENCRAMGGIAGHAGLFSNVREVYRIIREILSSWFDTDWKVIRPDVLKSLLERSRDFEPSMFRGGFDTPDAEGSQYGDHFSPEAIGHLGFTGTSFIVDLSDGFGVILLTNRVCPDRDNSRIKEFRRLIHNEIHNRFVRERGL